MRLSVLSLADGAAWEERLVAAFERSALPMEIVRRCVDVVDLLAVAASGQGRAVLIATGVRNVDAETLDRLLATGVAVVGVVARGDVGGEDQLRAAGVDAVLPDDAEPAVVAAVVAEAVRRLAGTGEPTPGVRTDRAYADPSLSLPVPPGGSDVVMAQELERRGAVVAVWGPTGAPGRTTVAMAVADELAELGYETLLVDADVYGGTVAALLGLLDESPGVAAACRQASGQRLDVLSLAALCWQVRPRLRVLTGLPLAARWPDVRPSALSAVLAAARALADFTVVDCGFCLESDEELSFDTVAPRRNGATLTVLDETDVILAVCSADPIGIQRLVRGLAELSDAEIAAPVWVVLNRVRAAVVPGDVQEELTAALERFAGRSPAAFLPMDTGTLDAATAAGRLLREANSSSPLRSAVARLAVALTGEEGSRGTRAVAAAPSRGRRRHRA
jgi:MinD-like ATPase involved in chromosome partitioning or flagellar assembly